MSTIFDVAQYILEQRGDTSAMKLQKLAYYAQAWSLTWTEKPLFEEDFQAWRNGPVSPELYAQHRGEYVVSADMLPGSAAALTPDQQDTVNKVLEYYGGRSPQWLSDLTHAEDPWQDARRRAGACEGEQCQEPITKAALLEYYSGL